MQYVEVRLSNGYPACNDSVFWAFPDDAPEEYIRDCAIDELSQHMESYEMYAEGSGGFYGDWEDEEAREMYYENGEYTLNYITKEEWEDNGGITM